MIGKSLGVYRIESKLGAGGMGVVYKAFDSTLGRPVALKVLTASSVANAERERRFVQEAKAASSLNHPNIVTIYAISSADLDGEPVRYIAMEFIAGETLDHVIGSKGLRVRDALKYTIQIADALAAAHAAGIVHRDLKPSNVMVTPQGLVKVLDFGLAKLNETSDTDAFADTMHGEGSPLTEDGTLLGTVAYMSPEQAEGKTLDSRSDIFSFGSLLYETLTGRRAFTGASKIATLSAILSKDPQPASESIPDFPEELERILTRCLKKDPARRWQSMSDVRVALEELRQELESTTTSANVLRNTRRRLVSLKASRWLPFAILAGLLLGLLPGAYLASRLFPPDPPAFQRLTYRRGDVTAALFAPGDSVAYSASWEGAPSMLFSTIPGNRESRALGTTAGKLLSVSATGEMAVLLGGEGPGTLARVPLGGGAPREVLENVTDADWAPDGESLAVVREVEGHHRLEYPVGTVLYQTDARPPQFLRISHDGKLIAYFEMDEIGDFSLFLIGANHPRQMLSSGWRGIGGLGWSPDGKEIWFSGSHAGSDPALFAVSLSGTERLLLQVAGWIVLQDVSKDGRVLLNDVNSRLGILFVPPDASANRDLAWLNASYLQSLSDDAGEILFMELANGEGRNAAIYLRKTDGSPAIRLGYGNRPALSRDGKSVVCVRQDPGGTHIVILPTGPGDSRILDFGDLHYQSVEWFPDGHHVLFTANQAGHPTRSWTYDLEGNLKEPAPVTPEGARATAISPDQHRLVRVEGKHLSLTAPDGTSPVPLIDLTNGEVVNRWSPDGRYLYLRKAQGDTILVSRVEVATRHRESWRTLRVPEPGATFLGTTGISADGKAFAASFQQDLANLYLVKGLK
jgi:eukaryotic-like serine/threonine-protein kinase